MAHLVQDYDLILVAERMDESVVALALLLDLSVQDVLVLSSKNSTQHSVYYYNEEDRWSDDEPWCVRLVPHVTTTSVVQAYLDSDEWRAKNYGDYLLHAAASKALDRTIDETIGRDRFEASLQEFQRLQAEIQAECEVQPMPCSAQGIPQIDRSSSNCYVPTKNFGCGYPCVDAVLARDNNHL